MDAQKTGALSYTVDGFCKATGLGRSSVWKEMKAGRIPYVTVCGRRLISHETAVALLRSSEQAGPAATGAAK